MIEKPTFASTDCRHIPPAFNALWNVWSEFGRGYCGMHWLALALALALASSAFTGTLLASLHSWKEGCSFKRLHSGNFCFLERNTVKNYFKKVVSDRLDLETLGKFCSSDKVWLHSSLKRILSASCYICMNHAEVVCYCWLIYKLGAWLIFDQSMVSACLSVFRTQRT